MEVLSGGVPIVEVAERYVMSRMTLHAWLRCYYQGGLPGLTDRSWRGVRAAPDPSPRGPPRPVHELRQLEIAPLPSCSTVYRVLVRHGPVTAVPRRRRWEDYWRWECPGPMQLH
jgi:transposase-like protein